MNIVVMEKGIRLQRNGAHLDSLLGTFERIEKRFNFPTSVRLRKANHKTSHKIFK